MRTVSLAEAKAKLSEIVDTVEAAQMLSIRAPSELKRPR